MFISSLTALAHTKFIKNKYIQYPLKLYIKICIPISQQFVASLALFMPAKLAKRERKKLGTDKVYFWKKILAQYLNIAQLLARLH